MSKQAKVGSEEKIEKEDRWSKFGGLEALAKEFKKGIMVDKKRVALRVKLIGLVNSKEATEDEQELMEAILIHERERGNITRRDEYMLNKLEYDRLEDQCEVKTDDAPIVHHLKKGMVCRFFYDANFNDRRNRPDSIGRFYVYIPRVIPSQHQYSYGQALKASNGHLVEDAPAPKQVIHRIAFKKREFEQWFEVIDDAILGVAPEKEEEFTF